ncbi:MAG: L-threonylcarbamoyladenylate synthase [Polyangiaceae bacterium]
MSAPRVLVVDAECPDAAVIADAARVLHAGGLVAFPTETVYGLGGLALEASSILRIYAAKGRPGTHPLIAHVLGEEDAKRVAKTWPPLASALAKAFWPGPLTLVVPKNDAVPAELTGGGGSVGIRAPMHPVARALLAATNAPIAAPSANAFQEVSPTRAAHVVKSLGGAVDLVLDGGACAHGIESTVVELGADGTLRVLRPGAIPIAALQAFGPVTYETLAPTTDVRRASPGQDARHYAPKATLVVTARDAMPSATREGMRIGAIYRGKGGEIDAMVIRVLPADPQGYAALLFATLHDLDDAGCDVVLVEAPPEDAAWLAVRDRLARASH